MVTGRMPFEAQTVGDLSDKIGRASYPQPSQYVSGLPRPVADVIARCLKRNPAERYSASELLRAVKQLESVVSKPGLSTDVSDAVTEYVETKSGGGSKKMPLLVGAAAAFALLAVVAVAAFFALGGGAPAGANGANVGTADAGAANSEEALKKGLAATPAQHGTRADDAERTVEINVSDGRAEVYRGVDKLGTTPYPFKGRLGERVLLTLRREGFKDKPVDFVVGEKKAYMYIMDK
jgi:hypothetical protein